jgi:hypothetical protein
MAFVVVTKQNGFRFILFTPLHNATTSSTNDKITTPSFGTPKCSGLLYKTLSQHLASSLRLADAPRLCANAVSFVSVFQADSLAFY